jgi:hypothetical protein
LWDSLYYLLIILIYLENFDYTGELDAPIDFLIGDFSGVSRCTNITIMDDAIVEYNEVFNVLLNENSSRLEIESTRNATRITIVEDNDCKHISIDISSSERTLP